MPTALELGPEGWKSYADALITRRAAPRKKDGKQLAERKQILRKVQKAAALLKAEFGAERVVLFGSMAHEAWFVPESDVDLAVDGLGADSYWRAWEALEEIIQDRPVDLIDLESASESLRRSIDRYGVDL
jgi:predicted nucleotidyltransferase